MTIPEPSLPEHLLIRNAAPDVQLSAGLKQRVLKECAAQARLARWRFRLSIGAATLAVSCLLFALLTRPLGSAAGVRQESAASQPASEGQAPSPGYSRAAGGSTLAGHQADPPGPQLQNGLPVPREMQQINRMIEERMERNRLLECALLPFL